MGLLSASIRDFHDGDGATVCKYPISISRKHSFGLDHSDLMLFSTSTFTFSFSPMLYQWVRASYSSSWTTPRSSTVTVRSTAPVEENNLTDWVYRNWKIPNSKLHLLKLPLSAMIQSSLQTSQVDLCVSVGHYNTL